jgi:hypothetical protein
MCDVRWIDVVAEVSKKVREAEFRFSCGIIPCGKCPTFARAGTSVNLFGIPDRKLIWVPPSPFVGPAKPPNAWHINLVLSYYNYLLDMLNTIYRHLEDFKSLRNCLIL